MSPRGFLHSYGFSLAVAGFLALTGSEALAASFSALDIDFLGRGGATAGLVALPGGPANSQWNPSGLACLRAGSGTGYAAYMDYLAGLRGATAGYAWSTCAGRGYGTYINYLTSGSIPLTTWSDPVTGESDFSYGELVAGFSGAEQIRRFLFGVGIKLARESLNNTAETGAFVDVASSLQLPGFPGTGQDGEVCLGAVGRNIKLAASDPEALETPSEAEIGLAVMLPAGVSGGLSFLAGGKGQREARIGVVALMSSEFEVRLGWRRRVGKDSDRAFDFAWQRGLTAGFGVNLGKFWLDYTYEDASPLDAIHRFALRVNIAPS